MELTSTGWIDKTGFSEIENIYNNREIIFNELKELLTYNVWPIFKYGDSAMTLIYSGYKENEDTVIQSGNNPSWRLFPIIANPFGGTPDNIFITNHCSDKLQNTINILKDSSNRIRIRGAAFSLFEPGYTTNLHSDEYVDNNGDKISTNYYRVNIPLLIPKSNNDYKDEIISELELNEKLAVFQLENDYRLWKDSNWFIWDPNYLYRSCNNTDEVIVILIIDVYKE